LAATNGAGGEVDPNEYGCRKSKAWIQRHPQYVKGVRSVSLLGGPMADLAQRVYNHSECASLLRPDQFTRLGFTKSDLAGLKLTKRASDEGSINGGVFNIITYDHLLGASAALLAWAVLTSWQTWRPEL
jgi:hypothetical protein